MVLRCESLELAPYLKSRTSTKVITNTMPTKMSALMTEPASLVPVVSSACTIHLGVLFDGSPSQIDTSCCQGTASVGMSRAGARSQRSTQRR